jgi:SAM-dependent methyltransferase
MDVSVCVADKSTAMLQQASRLIARRDDELVSTLHCDIARSGVLGSGVFDGGISTYGVWSFVSDPVAAFRTVFTALKPGAVFLAMAHGYANALESKLSSGASMEEIAILRDTGIVKWANHVPPLRTFSSATFTAAAEAAGFECLRVYGVGVVVHPGPEDFGYPYVSDSLISASLRNPDYFRMALETEKQMAVRPELADRGTNLLIALRKPS